MAKMSWAIIQESLGCLALYVARGVIAKTECILCLLRKAQCI